jgi:hypothetical protein
MQLPAFGYTLAGHGRRELAEAASAQMLRLPATTLTGTLRLLRSVLERRSFGAGGRRIPYVPAGCLAERQRACQLHAM